MFNFAASFESLYTVEYQQWHTLTKDDIASYVMGGLIDKDAYQRIVGEPYPETGDSNAEKTVTEA